MTASRTLPFERLFRRRNEEAVVREVLSFVGADPKRYTYTKKPPGMKVSEEYSKARPALPRSRREG